jgi:hypothetical protein
MQQPDSWDALRLALYDAFGFVIQKDRHGYYVLETYGNPPYGMYIDSLNTNPLPNRTDVIDLMEQEGFIESHPSTSSWRIIPSDTEDTDPPKGTGDPSSSSTGDASD